MPAIPVGGTKRTTPEDDEEDLQIWIVKVFTSHHCFAYVGTESEEDPDPTTRTICASNIYI